MEPFINAFKDVVVRNYSNFAGRLDRGTFWRFVAVNIVISIVLSILAQSLGVVFWLAYWVYILGVLVPGIAAVVRRLHDVGKTGKLAFLGLIPIVGAIILIVLCVPEGDPQANEYGPVPAPAD
jgi:uncharacterized membrane protein YhaH (DUF805 family)